MERSAQHLTSKCHPHDRQRKLSLDGHEWSDPDLEPALLGELS
jgi:hypothetical protein